MKNKKIALITGATRGIGLAIAKELANDGFLIVGTGTSQQSTDGLREELKSNNIEGSAYILDITDEHSVEKLYSDINKDFSETPDVVVNNAGITNDNLLIRMSDDQWFKTINTNLNSLYTISKIFLKPMIKKEKRKNNMYFFSCCKHRKCWAN